MSKGKSPDSLPFAERNAHFERLEAAEVADHTRTREQQRTAWRKEDERHSAATAAISTERAAVAEKLDASTASKYRPKFAAAIALRLKSPRDAAAALEAVAAEADAECMTMLGEAYGLAGALVEAFMREHPDAVDRLAHQDAFNTTMFENSPMDLAHALAGAIRRRNPAAICAALEKLDIVIVDAAHGAPRDSADEARKRLDTYSRFATASRSIAALVGFAEACEQRRKAADIASYQAFEQKIRQYRAGEIDAENETDEWREAAARQGATQFGPYLRNQRPPLATRIASALGLGTKAAAAEA